MDISTTKIDEIDLNKLFGEDRAQEDKNLEHYFIKTRQFKEIQAGSKELVLGRKGAGKSALFSILSKEAPSRGEIPISIAFDGEDYVHIENALKSNNVSFDVNDDFKFSLAWRDFIISEILFQTIKNQNIIDSRLKSLLSDKGYFEPTKWKRFATALLKVIKGARLQGNIGEVSFDFSSLNLKSTDTDTLKTYLNKLIIDNNYIILIDNLDEPWKNTETLNSWLRGLIFATRQLKRDHNNIKIVSFLRSDIYDIISKGSDLFDSKSEITSLSWDDNNYFNLRKLIAARIAYYFNIEFIEPVSQSVINDIWNKVFPRKFYYGGKSDNFWHYIISRTFQRPRELLQFCRLMFEKSNKRLLPLEDSIISPIELEFSNWKEIDLVGEYSKTYKNLDKCIDSFIGVKTTWAWHCKDLIDHIKKLSQGDRIFIISENTYATEKETIEILYKIGFLRKLSDSHAGRYKMYHQDNSINYNLTRFDIHPAFRKRFTSY